MRQKNRWRAVRSGTALFLTVGRLTSAVWVGRINEKSEQIDALSYLENSNSDTFDSGNKSLESVLCQPGFIKQSHSNQCTDIDECRAPSLNRCSSSNYLTCINTQGSYNCQCQPGFSGIQFDLQGHPLDCKDINECNYVRHTSSSSVNNTIDNFQLNPCPSKTTKCKNTPGSYYCECESGFQQVINENTQNIVCQDVDECTLRLHNCPHHSRCVNYDGTFNCVCDKGYEKTAAGHCEDVNECQEPGKNVCMAPGETCENTMPGFRCTCQSGFKRMYGRYCTDLDECTELENPCPPFSTCFNWYGGHSCNCIDGYEKTPSGFCEVVNTCKSKVTDKQCRFDCTGPYECICPFGYNSIHHRCTDINECFHNSDNCEPVQTCLNLYGSFKCVDDPVCPTGFSLVPSYRDFVNFFKAGSRRGRSSRRTRSVYTHICTKDAMKREKVLQGEYSPDYYYEDYTDQPPSPSEPKVQAIYWHYLTLRKRVKLNMKILRLDFTHRKQQEIRRVKYKFKFLEGAGNLMQDKFTIIQHNPRKPRALVRLRKDGEVIEGPGEIYLTIQMVAENFDGEIVDTVLIESVLFISEYNF